jgi:hypothetical protein
MLQLVVETGFRTLVRTSDIQKEDWSVLGEGSRWLRVRTASPTVYVDLSGVHRCGERGCGTVSVSAT